MMRRSSAICAECGGSCCKQSAGIYWPEDITPLTTERIAEMVIAEDCAIDWWEDVEPVYWIRPAHKNAQGKWLDGSWGGECVFLASNGCRLSCNKRPTQCRKLLPLSSPDREMNEGCLYEAGYKGKEAARIAWAPHQALMKRAVNMLTVEHALEAANE